MIRRAFLCCLLVAAAALPAEPAKVPPEILRYLQATRFGDMFQAGIRLAVEEKGRNTLSDQLLAPSPREIEAAAAPVFAAHLPVDQARVIADFFSKPTGRKVFDQGLALFAAKSPEMRNPDWRPDLAPAERREYETFMKSPAGQLFSRLSTDPAIRKEYLELVIRRYVR